MLQMQLHIHMQGLNKENRCDTSNLKRNETSSEFAARFLLSRLAARPQIKVELHELEVISQTRRNALLQGCRGKSIQRYLAMFCLLILVWI